MEEAEIIRHKRRFDIFKQLQNDKTLIKMVVLGRQYERLTVVTGTRFKKSIPYFLIDHPEGFTKAVANDDSCRIHFEFIGHDHLVYTFRTAGKEIIDSEICIRFPEGINRLQRRRNFRIAPPFGTKIYIIKNSGRLEMSVIDISRGGALGTPVRPNGGAQYAPVFTIGSNLRDIGLSVPFEEEAVRVHIKEALVRRLVKNPITYRDNCALQFTDIEKSQEKILKELIFRLQRDALRKKMAIE